MKAETAKTRTTATKSLRKGHVSTHAKAYAYSNPHAYFKAALAKPKTAKTKTVPFDVANHLRTPAAQVAYLNAWLEESPEDVAGIARAFGDVVRARGMSKVADAAGLNRESLYKALSAKGNPKLATVLAVANAMDLTIHLELPSTRARKRQLTPA